MRDLLLQENNKNLKNQKKIVLFQVKNSTSQPVHQASVLKLVKRVVERNKLDTQKLVKTNTEITKSNTESLYNLESMNSVCSELDNSSKFVLQSNDLFDIRNDFEQDVFEDNLSFPHLQDSTTEVIHDLSDLPLEDFINLENYVENLEKEFENYSSSSDTSDSNEQRSPMDNFQEENNLYQELFDCMKQSDFDNLSSIATEQGLNCNNDVTVVDSFLSNVTSDEETELNEDVDFLALLGDLYGTDSNDKTTDNITTLKRKLDNECTIPTKVCQLQLPTFVEPPSPIDSNSNHSSLSSISEHDRKTIRRIKNNEASKVTRAKRKSRHQDLFNKEIELKKTNAELNIQIGLMQKEAEILRALLIAKLSNA